MGEIVARSRKYLFVLLLSLAGALPLASFYISALFPGYTPLQLTDAGTVLISVPLIVGFLLGAVLSEHDMRVATFGVIATTITSSFLIGIFISSPIIAGVAAATPATSPGELIEIYIAQRVLFFVVLSFPILLLGAVIGNAIADRLIPSEELRRELEKLRAETREWHQLLERTAKARRNHSEDIDIESPEEKEEEERRAPRKEA